MSDQSESCLLELSFVKSLVLISGYHILLTHSSQLLQIILILKAVPDRNSMAPPELSGYAPIPNLRQPAIVDFDKPVWNNSDASICNSL